MRRKWLLAVLKASVRLSLRPPRMSRFVAGTCLDESRQANQLRNGETTSFFFTSSRALFGASPNRSAVRSDPNEKGKEKNANDE